MYTCIMKQIETKKIKYFSIQKLSFQIGDKLSFNLYIAKENRAQLFFHAGDTLSMKDIQELQTFSKVYINFNDLYAYKKYMHQKKIPSRQTYQEVDLGSITETLKSYMRHIFTNSADSITLKKLEPWVSHLTTVILQENTKIKDLLHLITKDYETCTHSLNVSIYAAILGKEIGMPKTELKKLVLSAMLLDIGKTQIDEKILYKKEALSSHEFKIIKMHATMGYKIAKNAGIVDKKILSGIHHHHERLDGSGYPNGFKNEHVSQFARIIGICDTYAAMSSNRVHKESKSAFEILSEMKRELKGKLDGELIQHFVKVLT